MVKWARDAVSALWEGLLAFARDPVGFLAGVVSGIEKTVMTWFGPLITWGDSVIAAFWDGLRRFVQDPRGFLEGVFQQTVQYITSTGGSIVTTINQYIQPVSEWLSSAVSWLGQTIFGWVDGALRWATDSFKWLQTVITDSADWTVTQVERFWADTSAQIGGAVSSAIAPISQAFAGLGDWLGAFANTSWLPDLIGTFNRTIADLWGAFRGLTAHSSPLEPQDAWTRAESFINQAQAAFTAQVSANVLAEAASLGQVDFTLGGFLDGPYMTATRSAASAILGAMYEASLIAPVRYYWQSAFTPTLPGVQDATRMLWRRGFSESHFLNILEWQGYNQMYREAYLELSRNLPGAQDLITFVVREVILPAEFDLYMGLQGFSELWSDAYWEAHWRLPAPEALYDAYHRNIITRDELDRYIVLHDYKPEPRPGIAVSDQAITRGLIKRLIARVDLRRGWELGAISDEQLIERFQWLGYEEDAPLIAEIQKRVALDAEIGKLRDNLKADYKEGYITEPELTAGLVDVGVPKALVQFHVQDAVEDRSRDYKKDMLDYYKDGYKKDLITDEDFRARVMEIIVQPEVADLYVEKAYVDKYKRTKPKQEVDAEKAAAEVQKLRVSLAVEQYRKYAIEKPDLVAALEAAGLTPELASARADYEEAKRPFEKPTPEEQARLKEQARIQKLSESTAVERFRAGLISSAQLVSELQAIGYSAALATAITQLEVVRALG